MGNDKKTTRRRLLELTGAGITATTLAGPAHALSKGRDENVVFVHPRGEGADVAAAARANGGRVVYDYENFDFVAVRVPTVSRRDLARDDRVGLVEDDATAYEQGVRAQETDGTADEESPGNAYGRDGETAPTVTTLGPTNVEAGSATLNGELTDLGSADSVDVRFDARWVGSDSWTEIGGQTLSSTGEFDAGVSVSEGYEYEFRAVAISSDGTDAGDVESFFASDAQPPSVATLDPTEVDENSATFHGELTDLGSASQVDVYFDARATGSEDWIVVGERTLSAAGEFGTEVSLGDPSEYEYRAVAESTDGSDTGDAVTFTTDTAEAPSVATLDPSSVDADSATLNGELADLGSADSVDVEFDARSVGADSWTVVGEQTLDATGAFEQPVSLAEDTEYEYRAVATSGDGSDTGDVTSFTTSVDYSGHPEQAASWGHDRVFGDSDAAKDDTYATATGDGVDIAILDGGIQHDHLDVADNVAGGVNFTDDGADWTDDQSGHGTHCAGVSAAVDNGIGTCGVAPGANLWAVKVLHDGSGYYSDIIAGIDWCISNGIEILSMSFGGSSEVTSLSDAIETAYDQGHLLVSSAGNVGNDEDGGCEEANVGFPAFHEDVVAVAAMDRDDTIAGYSSVGSSVELMAPGTNINAPVPDNDYTENTGTSMACPHVGGAAALGWAALGATEPDAADRDSLRAALESEAETVLGTCEEGRGMVRADRLVRALAE